MKPEYAYTMCGTDYYFEPDGELYNFEGDFVGTLTEGVFLPSEKFGSFGAELNELIQIRREFREEFREEFDVELQRLRARRDEHGDLK